MKKVAKKKKNRGTNGGLATLKKHGLNYFSKIAKKRWKIKREQDNANNARAAK